MIITETRFPNGASICRCTCCKSRHRIAAKYASEEFVCGCGGEHVSQNLILEERIRPVNKWSRK